MRALTLTQPWAALVASGIKLVENRPRAMGADKMIGERFAIHASRAIDSLVYDRILELAPELDEGGDEHGAPWHILTRVTSAVIGVARIDKVLKGGWTADAIAQHSDLISFSNGTPLGPKQIRWFFGPAGILLRDVHELATPVPCKGALGFWTLPVDVAALVEAQLQ